jgi:sigma-B regulation protein RsbU (phosphoserine phosphatase)
MAVSSNRELTSGRTGRILIADDQQPILFALQMLLGGSGLATETVTRPDLVLHALEKEPYDAVLIDLNYTRDTVGGAEGLDLISQIRSMDSLLPVVVMTAWSTVDLAVEAMRRGASDFVQKPWENHDLLKKLEAQLSCARSQRELQRQREEEVREAREIQDSLLPKRLPSVPGYEIAAVTQPLRFVGGDYYSIVRIDDRQTAFCIADVAGKGLPAALLMSSLHAALQPLISQNLAPAELCHRLNRILCDLTPVGKFISFFYSVLDSSEHRLTYCNAGHNPPWLIRRDVSSLELQAEGAVLGQFPHWIYGQTELRLRSGDELLLFTDGLVEASDASQELFGESRLVSVAHANLASSANESMSSLIEAASRHCNGHFQDDASLVVVRATGY